MIGSALSTSIVVVLLIAAALFVIRLIAGPTLADRVVAMNGLLLVGLVFLAVQAVNTDRNSNLPVLVVVSVVGFVGTAMIARFLRGRKL
ncbi:MAG TPA: monovalent cation/H+ antiporter complex subunit F [Ilumatobacteraceae bacterium]|nr:monovalent cation/H+ antiporter complex subunit F [Ilumatobacteraceae bacterium]